MKTAEECIDALGLAPHPEGGFYRETWRAAREWPAGALPGYEGARSAGTCIQFLLPTGHRSRLHRVLSDELWLHQRGDPLRLIMAPERDGARIDRFLLGEEGGERLQATVPGGWWQAAEALHGEWGYSLVSCVVVPGFEFADFEMA